MRSAAIALVLAFWLGAGLQAAAQPYATLAGQPDARDFVHREETHLTLLGVPMRFIGYDIGWLGVRADGSPPAAAPAPFEVNDALATVQALGGNVVRTAPLLAGDCADCGSLMPVTPSNGSIAALDLLLKTARDMGLKVVVPLVRVDAGASCEGALPGGSCAYLRAAAPRAGAPRAFFADTAVRAAFGAAVTALMDHVNPLTGVSYRNDPTILAWENCVACLGDARPADVAAWSEQLGQAVKAADSHHLYESGAFAGHIASAAQAVLPSVFATASVDMVGDDFAPGGDIGAMRDRLLVPVSQVTDAGRVYVMDSVSWAPSVWKTGDALQAWLVALAKQRNLSGALIGRLEGHAVGGGFLPAPPAEPAHGVAALYFPGIPTRDMGEAEMQARTRLLHRFAYSMLDVDAVPAYLLPPQPEIVSAVHGRLVWLGAAGAARYSIERSPDPGMPWTWQEVCDRCVNDSPGFWQDPAPPKGVAWYRVFPFNINGHKSVPSKPAKNAP